MFRRAALTGLTLLGVLVLAAPSPSAAGQRQRRPDGPRAERGDGDGGGRGGDRGGRAERAVDRGSFERPSFSPPERPQADRGNGGFLGRGERGGAGRNGGGFGRGDRGNGGGFGRGNGRGGARNDARFDGRSNRVDIRVRNAPQRPANRPGYGWNARPSYRPVYRPAYRPMYSRPFYAFRPRFSLGVGLWAGVHVPFATFGIGLTVPVRPYLTARYRTYAPYAGRYVYDDYRNDAYGQPVYGTSYPVPTPYPAPYPVPYPVSQPAGSTLPAQPVGAAATDLSQFGGLSFDIAPTDAEIYVDGEYAGTVSTFSPESQPLTLPVGVHRIEIRAAGYAPTVFEATVSAGLVTPYQGTLTPQYN